MKPLERIGRYTLLSRIGSGGSGDVWEALLEGPVGFKKRVALKLVDQNTRDGDVLRREARLGALLRHPNIVDVYEVGTTNDGRAFLAMELVPGQSLGFLLKHHGAVGGPALRDIAMQLSRGLAYVHTLSLGDGQVGLIHRDIKPNNVLLDPGGMVKIVDLGIARLAGAHATSIEGTPGYLAPEQLDGAAPAPTADVYSAGMVLWAMAIGKSPVRGGKGVAQALRASMTAHSKALRARREIAAVLPGLDDIVLRCLDPDPAGRFSNGHTLREALRALPEPRGEGLFELLASFDVQGPVQESKTVTDRTSVSGSLREEEQPLIGRSREVEATLKALEAPAAVVTLKGLGGIGKSRVAQRVAHQWRSPTQRAAWVDIGPVRSNDGLLNAVAAATGVPLDAEDADGTLDQALAAAGNLLLVLDRVDHVPEHVAARVAQWRDVAPNVRFLLTARRPVAIPGDVVIELGPLQADEAIELFLRASSRPPTDEQRSTVATLVGRLDHHPLAIELAAARSNLLGPNELLEHLDEQSDQNALEGVIAWSWEQLPQWSRHALLQLAVFRGTFEVRAAESVVDVSPWPDAPWPLDVIDDLWRRSLLYVRNTGKGPRLGMFESVRAYILSQAGPSAQSTREEAEARHGEWYARQGTPAALDALYTAVGHAKLRSMTREVEDLVAALETAVERGHLEIAEAAGLAAAEVLIRTGPLVRARTVLDLLLSLPGSRWDHARRLRLSVDANLTDEERQSVWEEVISAAPTHRRTARAMASAARDLAAKHPKDAIERCTMALASARNAGDQIAQSIALTGLGIAQRIIGENQAAQVSLTEAYDLCAAIGHAEGMAHAKMSSGNLLYNTGEYDAASEAYKEAETIFRRSGRRGSVASALGNQAMIYAARGNGEEAERCASKALRLARALGDADCIISCKSELASARMMLGDDEGALALHDEVIDAARTRGSTRMLTFSLSNKAHVLGKLGRHAETLPVLAEAVEVAVGLGSPRSEALAVGNLGLAYIELGSYDEAGPHLDRAIHLSAGIDPRYEGAFLSARARLATLTGRDPSDDIAAANERFRRVNDALEQQKLTCTQAVWLAQQNQLAAAKQLLATVKHDDPDLRRRVREARRQFRGL